MELVKKILVIIDLAAQIIPGVLLILVGTALIVGAITGALWI